MEVIINGNDISNVVKKVEYGDFTAARCDSLLLFLKDETKKIHAMGIKKGDTASASTADVQSGEMYVSSIRYFGDEVMIRALSTNISLFEEKTSYKDSISFVELLKEVEQETKCEMRVLNEIERTYVDVTRKKQNPLQYLEHQLSIEGFQFKVKNNTIYVYDEVKQETKDIVESYSESDFIGDIQFETKDAGMISSIENVYMGSDYTIKTYKESGKQGKKIQTCIACDSIGDSERFTENIMRKANMYEYTAAGRLEGLKRKAGQTVNIDASVRDFSGKYYIYAITNDLIAEKQFVSMRKIG